MNKQDKYAPPHGKPQDDQQPLQPRPDHRNRKYEMGQEMAKYAQSATFPPHDGKYETAEELAFTELISR
jgi:hypothetical protein